MLPEDRLWRGRDEGEGPRRRCVSSDPAKGSEPPRVCSPAEPCFLIFGSLGRPVPQIPTCAVGAPLVLQWGVV